MKKNKNPMAAEADLYAADLEKIIAKGKVYKLDQIIWLFADLSREGIKGLTLWQILTMIRINDNLKETK